MSRLLRHRSRHTVEVDTGKDWSEEMSEARMNSVFEDVIQDYQKEVERLAASRDAWKKLALEL